MSELEASSQQRVPSEATQPEPKRRELGHHPNDVAPPAHYLDNLSKIWLTKEALTELDRRTRKVVSSSKSRPNPQRRRPLTRGFHRELNRNIRSTSTPASEFVKRCSLESLRRVKLSARQGGPDLLDLRGYPEPAHPSRYTMSSTQSNRRHKRGKRNSASTSRIYPTATSTAITKTTKSSGAYNPNFEQRMIDNRIYPDGYEYPDGRVPPVPGNWEAIQQMLVKRRPSLSPSVFPEEEYQEFKRANAQVSSENKATRNVIPMIQGITRDERSVGSGIPFTNLADIMRGKSHKAKPDVYYGARPEQLDPNVRTQLSASIVPSTTETCPLAPNFFVEAKRPSASAAVALNQACFAGAVGARGVHSLQTYGEDVPVYDNNGYTLSSTYHSGQLKIYAHHLSQPNGPGTDPEYYMNQLRAFAMTDNRKTLIEGITAFRNAEAWTEAQRNAAIAHANAIAESSHDHNGEDDDDEDDNEDRE
ncbi:hypothetical protein BDY21DRAFT_293988 [Lineolata rhizophorae]|uniref:DUF7924 domain-containing protein n=1 Tax=Lineolata rhizophorae TaxID=578093 RepID=A0A6A6NM72_9PEZI|nr:hypothetical protein BDY21DRAFT_293988 [Lineolata rhizophorae]